MLTSYYASKKLDRTRHYLVRTSIGAPRFLKCDDSCLELAPKREWIGLPEPEYKVHYLQKLESLGAAKITELLQELETRATLQNKTPVLLCYEALHPHQVAEGQFCHRRLFAEWFEKETGRVLGEL